MNTKPILFSTEMVQAILEGRKTQTRRVVKIQPIKETSHGDYYSGDKIIGHTFDDGLGPRISSYQIGDILYVRETWAKFGKGYIYKTDGFQEYDDIKVKWKPSIHMPKKAARIFLEVVNVKVERLQDISEEDAIAEGVEVIFDKFFKHYSPHLSFDKKKLKKEGGVPFMKTAKSSFFSLWIAVFGEQNLDDNPFVWVYEFKVIEKPKEFNQ